MFTQFVWNGQNARYIEGKRERERKIALTLPKCKRSWLKSNWSIEACLHGQCIEKKKKVEINNEDSRSKQWDAILDSKWANKLWGEKKKGGSLLFFRYSNILLEPMAEAGMRK